MKLGVCYMVFDGEELLKFAVRSIRSQVDHISVTYQTTSYFGNPADPGLFPLLESLKTEGLLDEIIFYEPDLSLHHKENELRLRNIGLDASIRAGCTHHISFDVDEFCIAKELEYTKKVMADNDYDFSVAYTPIYYKKPTYLIYPSADLLTPFMHPVRNRYSKDSQYPVFPYHVEPTRRFVEFKKHKLFSKEEFQLHHMSYVRKDMRKKLNNSDNGQFYKKKDKFYADFDSYQLGGRVCLLPDFMNRRTIEVENTFGIEF